MPATWHHLNRNPADSSISNFVPLSSELNQVIGGVHSEVHRIELAYGRRPLPPELNPDYLLNLAGTRFRQWRDTDAYACAHLAYWMADWQCIAASNWRLKFDSIMLAIKYARHAFHDTILEELLSRRLLPLIHSGKLGIAEISQVLMELTSLYAWIGDAKKSNSVAMQLNRIILEARQPFYDKRKRRIAQTVGVLSPQSKLASMLLAEAEEAAEQMDARADVSASQATIAIVNVSREEIKNVYERLWHRKNESDRFFHPKGVKPMDMTLNNAIAEMWYLLLTSLYLSKLDTARDAEARLRVLIYPESPARRYLSPPPWTGCWEPILKACRHSDVLDRAVLLVNQSTQPAAGSKLIKALHDLHTTISVMIRNCRL